MKLQTFTLCLLIRVLFPQTGHSCGRELHHLEAELAGPAGTDGVVPSDSFPKQNLISTGLRRAAFRGHAETKTRTHTRTHTHLLADQSSLLRWMLFVLDSYLFFSLLVTSMSI